MIINDVIFDVDLYTILVELRSQLSLQGIELFRDIKESGNNYQTQCPYHKDGQERKPSGGFKKDTAVFHCFTCGATHSLIEVISNCFGYDDAGVFGFKWLLKNFATISIEERKDIDLDVSRGYSSNNNITNSTFVTEQELDKYRYYHPYMYKRKLNDAVIEMFDIGYDKETDCITFNCRNKDGNCLFVARRSVKGKYFNYPPSKTKEIYGIYELYQVNPFPKDIYICESMIDALTLWTHNKYACALNGLGTDLQFKQLNDMPCRHFILATDSDNAGMNARNRIKNNLVGKLVTQVILPLGRKDINECTWDEIENLKEIF